tara:strand:- start:1405 stop:2526 length:1122 start_codon:yes stop_codon:yes gene_type:complete
MKILINGFSAKTGGGKSILNNYLKLLSKKGGDHQYIVIVPYVEAYMKFESCFIEIVGFSNKYQSAFILPYTYNILIPKFVKSRKVDVIFNLADIPIKSNIKQIFLFDWAYAVYPDSLAWKRMNKRDLLKRRAKMFFFKRNIKYIDACIAQNEIIKERLEKIFALQKVVCINNAVSLDNHKSASEVKVDFPIPDGVKLLYLTYYYSHKNLEIFLDLARLIREKQSDFKLVITIDKSHGPNAEKFLDVVKDEKLEDIIINIGPVKMEHVPSLYQQCDALLMPTLLESFSGTYVEAMYHELPIITSDLDFAKIVCKNAAVYFNPIDEMDIFAKILLVFNSQSEFKNELVQRGKERLNEFHNWNQVFEKYQNLILNL